MYVEIKVRVGRPKKEVFECDMKWAGVSVEDATDRVR